MGSKFRKAFTVAELAIGVLLILIIGGPVVMTFRSGIELYTKTEANAEVTNGVRFTVDSFGRRISPMLDHTSEITILLDPVIPDPVPKNDNYLFLMNDKVVHRDISGDHFLEGSEHISGLTFTVPSSAVVSPDNYLLAIALKGSYKTAKLDVEAKQPLYNLPVKDGDNIVDDNYVGNVIYFKTPGAHDMSISFDVYDNATKIKINNSLMPKGTVILASYDLNITRNGIEVSYTDESSLDWYISDSTGSHREISNADVVADPSIRDNYQFLLVDDDNKPITVKTFDTAGYGTSGDFYIRTGTDTKTVWGGYGVIRARLSPAATTSRGKKVTGDPVWSPYVEINNKTFWQTWLDAIGGEEIEGFYNTNITNDEGKVILDVNTEEEQLAIGIRKANKIKASSGAFTVARLDYKYFDNDRLYSIWENRTDKTVDPIPSVMTVTNYSLLVNMTMNDVILFGLTLNNTPNTVGGVIDPDDPDFNDLGYSVVLSTVDSINGVKNTRQGVFVNPQDGSSTANFGQSDFYLKGITNIYKDPNMTEPQGDAYHPRHLQNSAFSYPSSEWWKGNHRILYTILEYYNASDPNYLPKYIIRVRFLKTLSDSSVSGRLDEIKLTDPWFIGPEFYASEPMWFGEFVGSRTASDLQTVDVRRYAPTYSTTVTAAADITTSAANRWFHALKYSDAVEDIFKARTMDLKTDAGVVVGSNAYTRLTTKDRDRYIGMQVYTDKETAAVDIYAIDIVPGFTADEIRSILPANGKIFEINETIPSDRLPSSDTSWYSATSPARNYNERIFADNAGYVSLGNGDNGSRYTVPGAGVFGLQHIYGTSCTCPLHDEIFKWIK